MLGELVHVHFFVFVSYDDWLLRDIESVERGLSQYRGGGNTLMIVQN